MTAQAGFAYEVQVADAVCARPQFGEKRMGFARPHRPGFEQHGGVLAAGLKDSPPARVVRYELCHVVYPAVHRKPAVLLGIVGRYLLGGIFSRRAAPQYGAGRHRQKKTQQDQFFHKLNDTKKHALCHNGPYFRIMSGQLSTPEKVYIWYACTGYKPSPYEKIPVYC